MNARSGWFEVDKSGLANVAGRRNKLFILRELLQNAWDEDSKEISVEVHRPANGHRLSTIRVIDDSPKGFENLEHAYTLFAPSKKVGNVQKRGRFNFGEKLVLALCSSARIETTTGTVLFDKDGRRRSPKKRAVGSMFEGQFLLNEEERQALVKSARAMLVPETKTTVVNGEVVAPRKPVTELEHVLVTESADEHGVLRTVYRTAKVRVFEVAEGETAHLYEMGIPVVETGDRWHVDIGQKVPLNLERENVPPGYLRDVRVAVANATRDLLTVADANAPWARDALDDHQCEPDTVRKLIELRFGEKAVTFDPSDQEANSLAVAKGYTLVHGSQLSALSWENVRKSSAMLPAGQVTPSPKPFSPDGRDLNVLDPKDWTPAMRWFSNFAREVSKHIAPGGVTSVIIADDHGWPFAGVIGGGTLYVNVGRLGWDWFAEKASPEQCSFLIHELGHTVESNHLSDRYHEALCDIGAKLARLAIDKPEVFR